MKLDFIHNHDYIICFYKYFIFTEFNSLSCLKKTFSRFFDNIYIISICKLWICLFNDQTWFDSVLFLRVLMKYLSDICWFNNSIFLVRPGEWIFTVYISCAFTRFIKFCYNINWALKNSCCDLENSLSLGLNTKVPLFFLWNWVLCGDLMVKFSNPQPQSVAIILNLRMLCVAPHNFHTCTFTHTY